MQPDMKQLEELAHVLLMTADQELTCDECLERFPECLERLLRTGELPAGMELMAHHLAICPECEEEFRTCLEALRELGTVPLS